MIPWLLACHPDDPDPTTPAVDPPGFETLAQDAGFVVGHGEIAFSDYENCCRPGASCLWNNPSTPYATYAVPPSPEGPADATVRTDGLSRDFKLRPDEALVLLGRTPPEARYFGFRSYLNFRTEPDGLKPVFGSLGPSLNHLVVGAQTGEDALWDAPFAIVTTADAAVERRVVELLVGSGWDRDHVHLDRIPYDLVRMGLEPGSDTFAFVGRVAVYTDPEAGAAYQQDPGTVLRLTPTTPEAPPAEPHLRQPLPTIGSGTDEQAWRASVDALGLAIRAAYPDHASYESESRAWHFETYDCVADNYCSGEIRDRYYARIPSFLLPNDDVFVVAYGVNHERTGKASYANVAVETVENQIGLTAVESDQFPGSARAWLPDDPLVDDLYVVTVARSCAGFPSPCIEVPTGCPGADHDEEVLIDFRAYLEPETGAAPVASELVRDRALGFAPLPAGSAPP